MTGKYSPERFKQSSEPKVKEKFSPFFLGDNPFPADAGLGLKDFSIIGRISIGKGKNKDTPFSEKLRENQIKKLNEILINFTGDRVSKVLWIYGSQGVGKTAFLQCFFDKPLINTELQSKIKYCYVTYDLQQETSFLYNPSKYLLEKFIKDLLNENLNNKIFHEAITGTIYKFITSDKFYLHKTYITNDFSDEDFNDLKEGIEEEGKEYIENLLIKASNEEIDNIIKLLDVIKNSKILNIDNDYFNSFIKPFVENRLSSNFLVEDKIRKYLNPRIKAKQEFILVNTVQFLTSGAFDHFVLIVDQLDLAWAKAKNAKKMKADFFIGISSLIRRLNQAGLILIFPVMSEAADELKEYTKLNPEASRIAPMNKNYIEIPKITNKEEVKSLIKEYLNKDPRRKELLKLSSAKEEELSLSEGLFPFDDSACNEILNALEHKTIQGVINLSKQAIDYVADRLEEAENPDKAKDFECIRAATIKDMLK